MERCRRDFGYFAATYCQVEAKDDGEGEWIPFDLWAAQVDVARQMQEEKLLVVLKARQLGLTWLCVARSLHLMLFHPIASILLFSLRDLEAQKLLKRLRGMHDRLPDWMRQESRGRADNKHELEFANGSTALALTHAGDSHTASLVVVDEADLIPNLGDLLASLKPTIADGGRMLVVSRSDKSRPNSTFKNIYRAAHDGKGSWRAVFLPWHARPGRTAEWYEEEKTAYLKAHGSLDEFHGNYPATPAEALSPRTLDKRIPAGWLEACYVDAAPIDRADLPVKFWPPPIPGLVVYKLTEAGRHYTCGADPAAGNPTSDDSAATWIDQDTGEEVALLRGKLEMSIFGSYVAHVCRWYNRAPVMVEENNHGHAVLKHLRDHERDIPRLAGHLQREGWVSSQLGKTLLYSGAADAFQHGETTIHTFETFCQLASVEGSTLRAPEGEHDDLADSYALALAARKKQPNLDNFHAVKVVPGMFDAVQPGMARPAHNLGSPGIRRVPQRKRRAGLPHVW